MPPTIDEQLSQLEKDIRQLQIEYDTYFSGGRPRPPADTEWRVQTTIKKIADTMGKLKYAERFRYNNLAARYAKFSEVWRQRAKRVEMGRSAFGYSKTARELEEKRLAEAEERHAAKLHIGRQRVTFTDPLKQPEQVQDLYRKLQDAKQAAGDRGEVSFEQFHKFVRQKTEQLKQQMHCQKVEYTVSLEGGQVKLKAKGV